MDYYPKTRANEYQGEVVCLVFEFVLGTTGNDIIRVYLNPDKNDNKLIPVVSMKGEFTFDRLQMKLTGKGKCEMKIDELRLGKALEDVI